MDAMARGLLHTGLLVFGGAMSAGCAPSVQPRDAATGCAQTKTRDVVVVAVDVSDAFTARQRDLLGKLLERAWLQVADDGEMRVYTLNGRVGELLPDLTQCREPPLGRLDGPKTKEFQAHAKRRQTREDAIRQVASTIAASAGVGHASRGSRIFEWLAALPAGLAADVYSSRQLFVVSDFRQYSPQFTNQTLPADGLNLKGYAVAAVVLGDGRKLPAPWLRVLKGADPSSLEIASESLPGSLRHGQ